MEIKISATFLSISNNKKDVTVQEHCEHNINKLAVQHNKFNQDRSIKEGKCIFIFCYTSQGNTNCTNLTK